MPVQVRVLGLGSWLLLSTALSESRCFHGCISPCQIIECVHLTNTEKEKQNVVQKFEIKVVQHNRSF